MLQPKCRLASSRTAGVTSVKVFGLPREVPLLSVLEAAGRSSFAFCPFEHLIAPFAGWPDSSLEVLGVVPSFIRIEGHVEALKPRA